MDQKTLEAARKAQMDNYRRYCRWAAEARERAVSAGTEQARREAMRAAEKFAGLAYHEIA